MVVELGFGTNGSAVSDSRAQDSPVTLTLTLTLTHCSRRIAVDSSSSGWRGRSKRTNQRTALERDPDPALLGDTLLGDTLC